MKLKFFKRAAVENSADLEAMTVTLPKSGKEIAIIKLVNDADDMAMMDSKDMMANGDHQVMVGEKKMSVNDLLALHKQMNDELDLLKDKKAPDMAGAKDPDIESMDNDEDKEREAALALAKKEEKSADDKMANKEDEKKDEKKEEKKENSVDKDKKHFDALKNAQQNVKQPTATVELSMDKVARGKARYGSN